MKINTLYNIFSKLLISRYLRSLTFLCAFLLLGFNGFGQAVTIEDENGNEDDGAITITATLDIAVPGGFTVDVSTVDGTATIADNDYTAVSSFTLTFAGNPGEQQFFTILPTFDSFVELDEDLTVNMANLSGTIAIVDITDSATITINNDDSDVITMGAGVALSEGNAGTTAFNFTANRTGATTSAATATFTVTGVSANAADFDGGVFPTGLATFAIGSSTAAITINVSGDTAVEANETFTVTLSAPSAGYTLGAPSTATGTINNDDSYTASITATDPTATEAGTTTGQFTVDLGTTNTSGSTIVVNFNIATGGSNATNTTDYANIGTSVSIANGARTGVITITPVDDAVAEGSETVILTLAAGTGYAVAGAPNNTATVTIADNDTAGVSIDDVSVNEGDGTATFTVTLNGAVFLGTIVSYSTANNTALAGSDYVAETSTVAFLGLNGETRTITIDISEDVLVEGTETFFVNLTNATGFAQLGKTQGIGTILDNDSYIATVTATDADAAESPLNTGTFTVGLNTTNLTGSPMVINYTVGGTAVSGSDYIALAGSVSIGNGQESATITLNPINDSEVEAGLETVIVSLASGTGYIVGAPNNATVNIASEDIAGISIDDVLVNENEATATFTVTLNANVPAGASVDYSTANNTATAGTDYTTGSGTLTFLGLNNETQSIVINILEDVVAEGTESFFVNLSNPIGLIQIDKDQGIGTIADNDNCIEAPLINSTPTIFCDAFTQDLDAYTDTAIPAGFELIWSSSSDFSNELNWLSTSIIDFEATFYGFLYNESTDCVSPPLEVTLVRNVPPEILSTTPATICGTGMATISATVTAGGSLFWYASESGGTSLEEGSSFSTSVSGTTTYYVEAFANGCFSEREAVTITVNALVDTGTIKDTSACSITGGGPTTVDLDDTRAGGTAGVWSIVGTPPSTITIGTDNIVDFEGAADGDYVFRFTTNTAVSPCVDESVEVTITVTTCTMDSDGDGLFDRDETALGLDPALRDTDADGIEDGVEVGPDINNPIDTDGDGIIDALDSNILDSDNDGIVDQLDPANNNPCIPNISDACRIDLALEKTVDKESVLVGREVIFTVTLTNLSQIMVTNIRVNDLVSPATGFQYVSSSATKGVYDAVAGVWQLDEVLSDEVNTLTITAIVPEVGTYQNIAAIVDSFPEDSNATNDRATASVTVTPRSSDECGFLFNQISPNGDGINDAVYINCIADYPNNTLQVYDRYGNEVFSANGYDNTWMATGKNGDLPKGTYFYILDLGDGTEVRKGWIQIIR
ncbi:MAG: Calx-beta domain-containing protein [Arenibacter sp.]